MNSNTNIVLVHGAWADASCWTRVIRLLQEQDFNVSAVQLSLNSLQDDIEVTRRMLKKQEGPTVLVGHSYGGAVITGAGAGLQGIKALVYIAGFGVDEGESLESLAQQGAPSAGSVHIAPDENGFLWLDRPGFVEFFASDVEKTEAAIMAVTQRPLSFNSFSAKATPPAWKEIPSWYLVSDNDQMIPPPAQNFMAERMGANTRHVAASHVSMVSHPQEVRDIILAATAE